MPSRSPARPLSALQDHASILGILPFGICTVDADLAVSFMNRKFGEAAGLESPGREKLTLAGLLGESVSGHGRAKTLARGLFDLALRTKTTRAASEERLSSEPGGTLLVRCEPMPDGGYVFVLQPAENSPTTLEIANSRRLNDVLLNLPLGLSMYGADERLIVCNAQYIATYALDPKIVKPGMAYKDVLAHSIAKGNQAGMSADDYYARRMQDNRNTRLAISYSSLWNGRTMQITNRPLPDGGWVSLHEDVTEKLEAEQRVAHLANHDTLTGLPNRNSFHAKMPDILVKVITENRSAAVLFMDLDHFKRVNDSMGHLVGDKLLVGVADRLKRFVRADDLIVRLGGDEFVIVQNNASKSTADILARRLITAMSEPFPIDGTNVEVGLSVGIALAPTHGSTSDVLLTQADLALYRSKARGGGNHCFSEDESLPAEEA